MAKSLRKWLWKVTLLPCNRWSNALTVPYQRQSPLAAGLAWHGQSVCQTLLCRLHHHLLLTLHLPLHHRGCQDFQGYHCGQDFQGYHRGQDFQGYQCGQGSHIHLQYLGEHHIRRYRKRGIKRSCLRKRHRTWITYFGGHRSKDSRNNCSKSSCNGDSNKKLQGLWQ